MIRKLLKESSVLQFAVAVLAVVASVAALYLNPYMPDYVFPLVTGAGITAVVAVAVHRDLTRPPVEEHSSSEKTLVSVNGLPPLRKGTLMLTLPLNEVMVLEDHEPPLVLIPVEKVFELLPLDARENASGERGRERVVIIREREEGQRSLLPLLRW